MNLLNRFKENIEAQGLFTPANHLFIAFSGGVDSVALTILCQQCSYDFSLLHCNFQLRGAESERDEEFARDFAKQFNRDINIQRFNTDSYASENKISIQVAARELRYGWFKEMIAAKPGSVLLTAHHQDDNIETLLMNFFKGTGIAGLHGIAAKSDNIVRPLLFARKADLVELVQSQSMSWVEDSSNEQDKYARNYLRHQVIPLLKELYPGVENNLANNIQRFAGVEKVYQQAIEGYKKRLIKQSGAEIHLPVLLLKKFPSPETVLYEILRDYSFSPLQTAVVMELLDAESGRYVESSTHRVIRNRGWLIIAPQQSVHQQLIVIDKAGTFNTADGELTVINESAVATIPQSANEVLLDSASIRYPLLLRKWKQGDYFYPLGMQKKKKLGRFLIDQKVSKTDKEKVWVIEMDKKIMWVNGYRIDDRFKITAATKQALRLHWKK